MLISSQPIFRSAYAVTPHDSNALPAGPCDALFVSGAGTITIQTNAATAVQFTVPAGAYIWCRASLVKSTGTAATGIVALYS